MLPLPELLDEKIKSLEAQLKLANDNVAHWKARYNRLHMTLPQPGSLILDVPSDLLVDLTREATIRSLKPDQLARRIVETVTRDKLFTAVLDQ